MSNQVQERRIIIPGDTRDEFRYGVLIDPATGVQVAMVKYPKSLEGPYQELVDSEEEGIGVLWFLCNRRDEEDEDEENPASRYEFRAMPFNADTEKLETPEDILERNTDKDGYVYLPKALRDGKHADLYFMEGIDEKQFTTRTERGMFEEVAWSPFGSIGEATKQEAQNLERNPLMRNWI